MPSTRRSPGARDRSVDATAHVPVLGDLEALERERSASAIAEQPLASRDETGSQSHGCTSSEESGNTLLRPRFTDRFGRDRSTAWGTFAAWEGSPPSTSWSVGFAIAWSEIATAAPSLSATRPRRASSTRRGLASQTSGYRVRATRRDEANRLPESRDGHRWQRGLEEGGKADRATAPALALNSARKPGALLSSSRTIPTPYPAVRGVHETG